MAHNEMVRACLEHGGWRYLLFLEQDMTFPRDLIKRVQEWTEPVVSGLYFGRRSGDPQPIAYFWNEGRQSIRHLSPHEVYQLLSQPGLYEVDVVGMGCTAIRRDVLENWPKDDMPWFAVPTSGRGKIVSDDVYFCRRAQDQGHKIWVDSSFVCKHIGMVEYDERRYKQWVISQAQAPAEPDRSPITKVGM